jgi:signal transduction histidine kinase
MAPYLETNREAYRFEVCLKTSFGVCAMVGEDPVDILVVYDLPDKLLVVTTILEELGQNLVEVNSGREALRRLLEQDFAVILLDLNLQETESAETAARIRQHQRCARTPIIFTAPSAEKALAAQGYFLSAVDCILFPASAEILRTKVGAFVDLFQKHRQLERFAEERIALVREQLAREEAAKTSSRNNAFIAMLSHELRNPLAPMRNALYLLCDLRLDNPVQAEALEVLKRQVQQLSVIVDGLIDVFRMTHRQDILQAEAIDLCKLVPQAIADHCPGIVREQRILAVDLPDQPYWVEADPIRIAQVLTNLLHNAIKFTNPGDLVEVRLTPDMERQRIVVRVRDTGIGIAPELLPLIFDPFAQANQGLDRRHGGLGLGLALVKGFVEKHKGGVHAASAGPGRGAEFSFWLPLINPPQPKPRPDATTTPAVRPLRILIVEDHRDTAHTLAAVLRHFGHQVELAHTGADGIALAHKKQPDVVLCDLGLPEMDGYEVARALRSEPATSAARLIAVSGYGRDEDRRRSEEAGFERHLTKPIDPLTLQRLLTNCQPVESAAAR